MEIWRAADQVRLMELLLNLAWLAIAVASYAALGWRLACSDSARPGGPSRIQTAVALSCALAVLFPVISLTDDLHEMEATLEDASSARLVIKQCGVPHLPTSGRALHSIAFVVASFGSAVSWTALGGVAAQKVSHPSQDLELSTPTRAPPAFTATRAS